MDLAHTVYAGRTRKLVVALDIGTTFSGAAYAFLDPGEIPRIRSVTKYLNNPNPGSSKIPSILYYDQSGNFRGVENGVDFQERDEYLKLKWWKLMLSPGELPAAIVDQMSTKLPWKKTIIDVYADFMRYLFDSAKELFKASEPNGEIRWKSISDSVELVLTHPNGWGGPQQVKMRRAAVKAGIVPDTRVGYNSVHFVTEGEASFNFCAVQTNAGGNMKPGDYALIVDVGGGTIDISTYKVLSNCPLQVEELYEPKCLVQGGEFVTVRATAAVKEKLKNSKFNTPEDLAAFSQRFDEGVKRVFSTSKSTSDQYVRFGFPRDSDPKNGIRAGRLTLTGPEVAKFFEPSIQSTADSIRDDFKQLLPAYPPAPLFRLPWTYPPSNDERVAAFLVGGFATSPWVSEQLQRRLSDLGFQFCKPDEHTNKAVAIGAISYYVDHFVTGRISKFTYGLPCCPQYYSSNPEHVKREHKTYINYMGDKRVPGCFKTMLTKGTKVLEDREIRCALVVTEDGAPPQHASSQINKYTGTAVSPEWEDVEPDKFQTLCHVRADISSAPYRSKNTMGKTGYLREFDVILLVGLTELKAQISWENTAGKEERSDAVVVYDNPSERIH